MILMKPFEFLLKNPLVSSLNRTIDVPDNLGPITTYDASAEAAPEMAGLSEKSVQEIWDRVQDLYRTGITPGLVFTLRRRGHLIINRAIGYSHGKGPHNAAATPKVLMTPETPICQFSASKAVTAMLLHLLVERGEVHLLDPVCHYLPEFAAHGKEKTTVYHIISHHGGIPLPPPDADPQLLYDLNGFIRTMCKAKPAAQGGRQMAYHAITGGAILAGIIERVTGMDLRDFLRDSIQKPLAMKFFNYGVKDEDIPKVARNYSTGFPLVFPISKIAERALSAPWDEVVRVSNTTPFLKAVIPAGNLVATSDDMCRFFQLLLNGGELDGLRIFNPLTIQRATMESDSMKFDGTMVIPMRYSAGLMLGASPAGLWGPFSQNAYGHIGFINIMCWADPDREIAVSLQTTGKCLVGGHLIALARLLAAISYNCRSEETDEQSPDAYQSLLLPIKKFLGNSLMSW